MKDSLPDYSLTIRTSSLRPSIFKTAVEPFIEEKDHTSKHKGQSPSSLTSLIPLVITTILEENRVRVSVPGAHNSTCGRTAVSKKPYPFATPAQEYERIKLYEKINKLETMKVVSAKERKRRDSQLVAAKQALDALHPGKFTKAGALRLITPTSLNHKLVKIWDENVQTHYLNYKSAEKAYSAYVYGWQNKQPISFDFFKKLYTERDVI